MSGLVNRMNTPRRLARLTVPVMAAAALVASAPIANADPVNDAYLAQLRAVGLNWPPEHDAAMIGMAQLICDDLGWGWTPDHIAQDVHANLDPKRHFNRGCRIHGGPCAFDLLPQPEVLGSALLSGPGWDESDSMPAIVE